MPQTNPPDHARVIASPPLIMLGLFLAALAAEYFWPVSFVRPVLLYWAGMGMMGIAGAVIIGSAGYFHKKGTNVETWKPTETLVTTGLYAYSRNPIYSAFLIFFTGLGIASGNGWNFILLPVLYLLLRHGVIAREEIYLTDKFGDTYRQYQAKVRRWL